ncbi:MAG: hypothetical protein MJZ04_09440 [Bacteroidales bacterium]|nr:hypothetical protein [Bacteroidales bacterium]
MKRAVILIAALILASASLRAETLKVMSFNMRTWTRDTDRGSEYYWRTRMEAMERMIEDIGDWNNPLSVMDRNGLKMQSVRSILGVPEEDTFANFKRPEQSHGAIDHFFVNGVRAVSYRMVTDSYGCSKISDHYPIVAEIEI